jgi:catechol 2,3-dioxygenase-like lactoylglutathione lyase family enzyme
MFELDHVAVQTADVPGSVTYYVETFGAEVLYQDSTWALLRLGQGKLALVTPSQHPPHVALRLNEAELEVVAAQAGKPVDTHRDGSKGIYIEDPSGNVLELICYPKGKTVYEGGDSEDLPINGTEVPDVP